MKDFDYTVIYEPLAEGGYMVVVPALPGVISCGENLEEARMMAADAIQCHCEGLILDGEELPEDSPLIHEPISGKIVFSRN
ncbi:MAG: type II toxin-antitoxin system HicB family antitoxin [bacterium]